MTKWKLVPVEPTRQMINAAFMGMTMGNLPISGVYADMLKAAPQPPKLSDERILEIWANNSGRPVTMGKARIIAQARAIEREILGDGHE